MSSGMKQRKGADKGKAAKNAPVRAESETNPEKERIEKMIEAASAKAPPGMQPYIRQAAPILAQIIVTIQVVAPYLVQAAGVAQIYLAKLPEKVLYSIVGIAVCFFGGIFPATIAAAEAWHLCGGTEAIEYCKELWQEIKKFEEASAKDDKKDADNDGKADVDQLDPKELLGHKVALALRVIDPERCSGAITGLYGGWVGVLATLKIQFAKVITLGEVIGQKLYGAASRLEPTLIKMTPEDYQKWVPVLVRWSCKCFAISFAWMVQRIISAFHAAIRGAFMFSKYLTAYLREEKQIDLDTMLGGYADDIISWSIAAAGFIFQFMCGFSVPFPFWLFTWPLNIVEYFIVYSVSSSSSPTF